ncbi:MAG: GYD domain-containing protein [Candidatus Bathyarchaeia archaeon]
MIFVTILVVAPDKCNKVYEVIKDLKTPKDIRILSSYGLFGEYDAVLIYEAPDHDTAMDFLLDVCKIGGIIDTKTFAATQLR